MMKKILPFRAYFYNQGKIESLKDVIAPPYDVISPDLQDELYEKSPYNFCRVDFTKEEGQARYDVAKATFEDWLSENTIVQENSPALYFHHHSFVLPNGERVTRKGFFAVRRLEDFSEGGIKPHEKTLDAPKQDRLSLMRATESQFSPVFSLYSDPEQRITRAVGNALKATPFMDFTTDEGERHQVWKIKDEALCALVDDTLGPNPLFIADGHHRYETALNYRNEVLQNHPDLPENAACRHILMYFSNMNDEGLVILPIHRALHSLSGFDLDAFLEKLSQNFSIEPVNSQDEDELTQILANTNGNEHAFLLLTKDPARSFKVTLAKDKWLATSVAQNIAPELAELDVTVLHRYILQETLGLSEESQAKQDNIIYWKSTGKAIEETWNGTCDVTFLLNPTRITDMENVALAGLKMPQKSTFFYPKIASGLFLHSVKASDTDGF